jgi:carbamoyl-phosphate synthase large subunit
VDLIINIPTAVGIDTQTDGYYIRRMAVDHHIPLVTNTQIAQIMLQCLINLKDKKLEPVLSWQEYIQKRYYQHPTQLRAIA